MSRSYKKHPRGGDEKGKESKRIANKYLRNWLKHHLDDLPQKQSYKKIYSSWNICDYEDFSTFEEYYNERIKQWKEWCYKYEPYPDRKKEYKKWYKWYKMK